MTDKSAGWLALGGVVLGTLAAGAWLASRPARFGALTSSEDTLTDWIRQVFGKTSAKVEIDVGNPLAIEVSISDFLSEDGDDLPFMEALREFETGLAAHGWHVAQAPSDSFEDPLIYYIHKNECLPAEVPPFVYHVTRAKNAEKIAQEGLRLARGGSRHGFKYPPRVFFAPSAKVALRMGEQELGGDTVVEVDTSKVPGLTLCADPQFDALTKNWSAAYAEKAIPPEAVRVLRPEEV